MKVLLALALVVVLLVGLGLWGAGSKSAQEGRNPPSGSYFEVEVERPRSARPFAGLLPQVVEARMVEGRPLQFDSASPGAAVGEIGAQQAELWAEGWRLELVADGEGAVLPETYMDLPVGLAGEIRTLRCRPADQAVGRFETSPSADGGLDGIFVFELASCINTASNKRPNWPPQPLTVRGSFRGLN